MQEKTAPDSNFYNRAFSFFAKGKIDNAEKFCQKAIAANSNNFNAYNLLGMIAYKKGRQGEAFSFIEESIRINPSFVDAYNNLGLIYSEQCDFEMASNCFKKSIEIEPSNTDTLYRMACTFSKQKMRNDAIKTLEKALNIDPNFGDAHDLLGNILTEAGSTEEAINHFKKAIENTADHRRKQNTYLSLFKAMSYLTDNESWKEFMLSTLKQEDIKFDPDFRGDLLNELALAHLLGCQIEQSHNYNEQSAKLLFQHPDYIRHGVISRFNTFLRYLTESFLSAPPVKESTEQTIYFVGDSHSLTCIGRNIAIKNELYKCNVDFIQGCKIWHLIKDGENKYKTAYKRIDASIPSGSKVIYTFGEIECRYYGGLFQRHRKYNTSLEGEADLLIKKYFSEILIPAKQRGIFPIVWGVPAPREEYIEVVTQRIEHKERLIGFVKYFNKQLKNFADENDMPFIDNYKATANSKDMSDSSCLADFFHLKIETYIDAIKQTVI